MAPWLTSSLTLLAYRPKLCSPQGRVGGGSGHRKQATTQEGGRRNRVFSTVVPSRSEAIESEAARVSFSTLRYLFLEVTQ